MQCPDYRLRLFLSVDLVGSTAFKASFDKPGGPLSPNPRWVTQIKHFYREFPEYLRVHFSSIPRNNGAIDPECGCPLVWKTIGDEIVFCSRLSNLEHLAYCLSAFLLALKEYGAYLDKQDMRLDVKAYGWVAAFPAPNVTVEVHGKLDDVSREYDLPDEDVERLADENPSNFDFLGKGIDSGFRSGKFCSAESLMLSLELAYLTSMAAKIGLLDQVSFRYGGKESLKGVINDRPYPLVFVDVERNRSRKDLRDRERALTGAPNNPLAMHVYDFIADFMADEKIERPTLISITDPLVGPSDVPASYKKFVEEWGLVSIEVGERTKEEAEAEAAVTVDATGGIPPEVTSSLSEAEQKISEAQK